MFVESHEKAPEEVILDVDTTDLPLHGKQEGRFFHGCYDHYCYLPLYVFCGEHVLCARLRQSNCDASAGSLVEIERIVDQIRRAWPTVKIILRGDSGFCRNELMSWCESKRVDYAFGLARNQRLRRIIGRQMWEATEQWNRTGELARVFTEFKYPTRKTKKRGWDRERRVVAKAEHIDGKENPRFVVTSLSPEQWAAQALYKQLYCARGDMENRIKEQFSLFADRVSAETMRANQLASVFLGSGLCAGQRIPAAWIESNRVCASTGIHHSHEATEDRCTSKNDGAQDLDLDGIELPVAKRVSAGLVELTHLERHREGQSDSKLQRWKDYRQTSALS